METLTKYLKEYFQEDDFSITRLKGGVSRMSYLAESGSGDRYVVHLGGSISFPRTETLATIQNSLAESGMRVPKVIHGPKWVPQLANHIEICTFLEGLHLPFFSTDEAHKLGVTIAELHELGTKVRSDIGEDLSRRETKLIKSKAHLKHALLGFFAYHFGPHASPVKISFAGFFKGFVRWLKCKKRLKQLRHSYCHLDLNTGNIIKPTNLSATTAGGFAFLDFEKMEWAPCLFDLAIAACMSVGRSRAPEKFDVDNFHHFVAGYDSIRKLSATELKLLQEFVIETACHSQRREILNWHRGDKNTQIAKMRFLEDLKASVSKIDSICTNDAKLGPRQDDGSALAEAPCQTRETSKDRVGESDDGLNESNHLLQPSPSLPQNPIERAYLNEKTGLTGEIYASVSQQVRSHHQGAGNSGAFTIGASYTAPLFYGFVQWCLQRAAANGIHDIYFLARDGHILMEIAKRLQPVIAPKAQLRYLYISRQATLFTSITTLTERSLDWVFEEMDNVITLERVAHRLRCECAELEARLPSNTRPSRSERLSMKQICALREAILDDHAFRKKIEGRANDARQTLIGYLAQSGIHGNSRIAIVDIGWKTTIQDCIYRALSTATHKPQLQGYYFGCSRFSKLTCAANQKHPYLITPSNLPGLGPFLELLLMAPHGTTLGYRKDASGQFHPVLKTTNPTVDHWDMQAYFDGIIAFTEGIIEWQLSHPDLLICPLAVDTMLLERLKDPPLLLAENLGDLPYCGDQEESNPRTMAPAFSFGDACKYRLSGRKTRSEMTQWYEASAKRSCFPARLILACDLRKHLAILLRDLVATDRSHLKLQKILKKFEP
jgi:Ser/Thr protein kinase RdoA (MazF antagonist)